MPFTPMQAHTLPAFPARSSPGSPPTPISRTPSPSAWGLEWVAGGGGEVRFRRPVFDGDLVRCTIADMDGEGVDGAVVEGGVTVNAVTDEPEQPRATFRAVPRCRPLTPARPGETLPVKYVRLDGEWGSDYGARAGDGFALYSDHGIVHPAVWPALANHAVHTEVARGSWIHTRSIVRHHALAAAGAVAAVHATVVRRFESHGERAVLDVHVMVDGRGRRIAGARGDRRPALSRSKLPEGRP